MKISCPRGGLGIVAAWIAVSILLPVRPQVAHAQGDTACVVLMDSARVNKNFRPAAIACAFHVDTARRHEIKSRIQPEMQRLAEIPWFIPEYHDEQRLHDGSGGLGPMAYIFASPYLSGFTNLRQFIAHGRIGVLVALVDVRVLPGESIPPSYSALHLKDGLNCVWLAYRPSAVLPTKRWIARVSTPPAGKACDRTAVNLLDTLVVVQRSAANVPPVTRFGEGTLEQPLLGFKCLNAWCEAGAPGFVYSPPKNGLTSPEGQHKGWHDEQRLTTRSGSSWRRSIRASVVPRPNLASFDENTFTNTWVAVADIVLQGDPPAGSKYDVWGLRSGSNRLDLRRDGTQWKAQLTRPDGTTQDWRFVGRMPHYDAAVPGTARWRWTILDDGVWVPCGQACCQVEGIS